VLAADGGVAAAGTVHDLVNGAFTLPLREQLPPGAYTVLLALVVGDNLVDPAITVVPYRLDPGS
jgi:hypothetical protein